MVAAEIQEMARFRGYVPSDVTQGGKASAKCRSFRHLSNPGLRRFDNRLDGRASGRRNLRSIRYFAATPITVDGGKP
jgi:hypothetical protein